MPYIRLVVDAARSESQRTRRRGKHVVRAGAREAARPGKATLSTLGRPPSKRREGPLLAGVPVYARHLWSLS